MAPVKSKWLMETKLLVMPQLGQFFPVMFLKRHVLGILKSRPGNLISIIIPDIQNKRASNNKKQE